MTVQSTHSLAPQDAPDESTALHTKSAGSPQRSHAASIGVLACLRFRELPPEGTGGGGMSESAGVAEPEGTVVVGKPDPRSDGLPDDARDCDPGVGFN